MKFTQRFLLIFTLEIDSTKVTLENSLNESYSRKFTQLNAFNTCIGAYLVLVKSDYI